MSTFVTAGQRARMQCVLVRELAALRDQALAQDADSDDIASVFRRRAALLRLKPGDDPQAHDPLSIVLPSGADYSAWW